MQVELESGLKFQLNQSDLTATVASSPQCAGHVQIPRVVSNNGYNYSVTVIGVEAFKNNRDIIDIFLPDDSSVTTIESFAFTFSALQKIKISASVNSIDIKCFERADDLVDIEISDANPIYKYVDDKYLVQKSEDNKNEYILIFARRDLENAVIPKDIVKIASKAFYHCAELKTVSFDPDGCILKEAGTRAFNLCKNLSLASFPNMKTLTLNHKAFRQVSTHFVKLGPPDMVIKET